MTGDLYDTMTTEEDFSGADEAEVQANEVSEQEAIEADYSGYSKQQFAELLKELSGSTDVNAADRVCRQIRPFIDELRERERGEALTRFTESGGKQEDFSFRGDDYDLVINGAIRFIKEKRIKIKREQDELRKQNLIRKEALLENIRQLVERGDKASAFNEFKKLQEEWRSIGPVPIANNKTIWASYHALVDLFYDRRSIYLDLLELDRKKNLEAKQELCVRAEKLKDEPSLGASLKEVNELHNEWKHIGPVPVEEKDAVWARFKAASDAVYGRRDEFAKAMNERLKLNREKKLEIIAKVAERTVFDGDSIKEWNARAKDILALRQEWSSVGPVEKNKTREINKAFWAHFKDFFNKKGQFFKKLDAERGGNLLEKKKLVEQALQLKDSEDMDAAAEKVKVLQRQWKEIGPVPEKHRVKIFDEFKAACDHLFDRRREKFGEKDREQEGNLVVKEQVIAELLTLNGQDRLEDFRKLIVRYQEAGFVPRKSVGVVREKYEAAVEAFVGTLPAEGDVRDRVRLEVSLSVMKNDPDALRRLAQQEQQMRRKLHEAENELAVLRNNLEFFARSKNADYVRQEFAQKISGAEGVVARMKAQLKLVRQEMSTAKPVVRV